MSACVCCLTRNVRDKKNCGCRPPTCRRHAPLCREHYDCGPPDEEPDALDLLEDPSGPFGDLPSLPRPV
ncbi:MAG: hypothetical protein K2X87_14510 [Gemmataceae bacterium]|nr:hypothetical protein [Gemmataceae bacterium]